MSTLSSLMLRVTAINVFIDLGAEDEARKD